MPPFRDQKKILSMPLKKQKPTLFPHPKKTTPKMNDGTSVTSSFTPHYMFFYGSLMDPDVLCTIAKLPSEPSTKKGSIKGFTMKMWGLYPTLVPAQDANDKIRTETTVQGIVWKIESEAQFQRLAAYETSAYTSCTCTVILGETGETLTDCRTFCWAGDADSNELSGGSFDLELYQKYFKPSIFRRPNAS